MTQPLLVRIVKNWTDQWMSDEEFLSQTPASSGIWNGVHFTLKEISDPDYLIIFNRPRSNIRVTCRPSCVWGFVQEPPNEIYSSMHRGQRSYGRVFMSDPNNKSEKHILSHPPIPNFVGQSHDFLKNSDVPSDKRSTLCCIISKNRMFKGHLDRLKFLQTLQEIFDVQVYGHGFHSVRSKWDTLIRYKYALVLENCIHPWYWSEKISDCFLTWTMPIYMGCPRIGEYFPDKSFIPINSASPEAAARKIMDAIESNLWEKNFSAVAEARRRTLYEYGCFPYISRLIREFEDTRRPDELPRQITVRAVTPAILHAWCRSAGRAWRINVEQWAAERLAATRSG